MFIAAFESLYHEAYFCPELGRLYPNSLGLFELASVIYSNCHIVTPSGVMSRF